MAHQVTGGWRTGLAAGLILAVAFFATLMLLPRNAGGVTVEFVAPDLSSRTAPAPVDEAKSVPRAIALTTVLSAEVGRVRALCMDEQGFPQSKEALAAGRAGNPDYERSPLSAIPLEFGPSTRAEASTYGFAGVASALDEGELGTVLSKDARFEALMDRCDTWLYSHAAPQLRNLQSRAARLSAQATRQYHDELVKHLGVLTTRRIDCVRSAYPAMPSWKMMRDMDEEEVLHEMGIPTGRHIEGVGVVPDMQLVQPGTVRVFPPRTAERYLPSREEIRFARTYADCGRRVGFSTALTAASAQASAAVERRWTIRSAALTADIETALTLLRSSSSRSGSD